MVEKRGVQNVMNYKYASEKIEALTVHFIGIKTDFFTVTATLSGRHYYDFHFPVGETEARGN